MQAGCKSRNKVLLVILGAIVLLNLDYTIESWNNDSILLASSHIRFWIRDILTEKKVKKNLFDVLPLLWPRLITERFPQTHAEHSFMMQVNATEF